MRQALALCQKMLMETCAKLTITRKELRTLNAALPAKKCRNIKDKTDHLNENIGRFAKKFAMLHRLWVISGLFPIKNNPDVDLWSASCWESPAAKRDAIITELFMAAPESLQKEIVKYKSFGSAVRGLSHLNHSLCAIVLTISNQFTSTLNQERSNMLRAIKEALALIFAPLKVPDTTIFTSPARKRDDAEMKQLSMSLEAYHRLAPVLFADPNQMTPDGFLKNVVLVNVSQHTDCAGLESDFFYQVLRLLIFGRNVLTGEKACGGPKARGQIHGVHSMTEGLIALAAIFVSDFTVRYLLRESYMSISKVRYLLSPDSELQAVGSETKIPYEEDYDFYLEHLFKHSKWAIDTVGWFNTELFGSKKQTNTATEPTAPPTPTHTWEDDFLDNLDNAMEPAALMSIGSTSGAFAAGDTALKESGPAHDTLSFAHSPGHSLPPPPVPPSRSSLPFLPPVLPRLVASLHCLLHSSQILRRQQLPIPWY